MLKNSSDSSLEDEPFLDEQEQDAAQQEEQTQASNAGNTLPMANGTRSVKKISIIFFYVFEIIFFSFLDFLQFG